MPSHFPPLVFWRKVLVLEIRELIHIGEQNRVGISRKEHFWDSEFYCKKERALVKGASAKTMAWIVDGHPLIQCSTAHMRPLANAQQTVCSLRDGSSVAS